MAGYIKDHRKELDSDIWLMPPLYHRVWQYLKYKVNHADVDLPQPDGSYLTIKKGQHLTTLRDIAEGVSWMEGRAKKTPNPHTISKILEFMVKRNMIAIDDSKKSVRGNRKYTLISLLNWEKYQFDEVTGNTSRHSEVTNRAQNNNELIITTTTTTENRGAYASESMNLPDDVFTETEPKNKDSPFIQILDAYCRLHNKIDLNIKEKERSIIRNFVGSGIPAPFVISTMQKLYSAKKQREENEGDGFSPPTSFAYYQSAIEEAWKNEQISQTAHVPSGTVAQGYRPARKGGEPNGIHERRHEGVARTSPAYPFSGQTGRLNRSPKLPVPEVPG